MKKYHSWLSAVGILAVVVSMVPLMASADTSGTVTLNSSSSVEAKIASLMQEMAALHLQLQQILASATPSGTMPNGDSWLPSSSTIPMNVTSGTIMMMNGSSTCLGFDRNLGAGARGTDVSALQQFLAQDPTVYPQGNVTGYFGSSTAEAVIRFQKKNDIASSSAGFFGPITRQFFSGHCMPMPPMIMMNASGTMTMASGTWHPMPPLPMGSSSENGMPQSSSTASGTPIMHHEPESHLPPRPTSVPPPPFSSSTASGSPMVPPPPMNADSTSTVR